MNSQFVVSITGPDQAGILTHLSSITHQLGGRWLNSKLVNMDGRFVALLKVDVPAEHEQALRSQLSEQDDLQIQIHELGVPVERPGVAAAFTVNATDQPGLINDITQLLANHGINIEHFDSHRVGATGSSGNLFTAKLAVTMPAELDINTVINELETLHEHLVVHAIPVM
ncbi:glycine cleavage system protein R [Ferrimonas pelagia]|uniref:Glycine cleavage system transcriptional repressor n=1 Tax=Ferrimonas pelagia TaxID=1177826 RepID=A0ABP9EFU9_9GAMM